MRKSLFAVAVLAALVGPASAATVLDFTTGGDSGIGAGNLSGTKDGIGYAITGSSKLTNSTHKTNAGCTEAGWDFACAGVGNKFDVGLGIDRPGQDNINEIDKKFEFIQVKFDSLVRVLGFAGMLAYYDSQMKDGKPKGYETVKLGYSADGGSTWKWIEALPRNDDNDPGTTGDNLFNTVGLAYLKDLSIIANVVRFTAGGKGTFDDGNSNVTAAGLIVAPVPIPASLPLLLAGLGALGFAARRKRKSA